MGATKNPLRAKPISVTPLPAPLPLRDLLLRAPLRSIVFSATPAPRSDNNSHSSECPELTVAKVITRFIVNLYNDKNYSTNFDQCHVTVNHKDYTNRQQKRSPLSPPTVNRLWAADSACSPLRSRSATSRSALRSRSIVFCYARSKRFSAHSAHAPLMHDENSVKIRNSSGDEMTNVNCFTTTSYTYYKVQ